VCNKLFFGQLLNFEPKASEQVPLLLKMNRDSIALTKAIESGDTDLGIVAPSILMIIIVL